MAITTLDGVLAGAQAPVFFTKAVTPTLVAGKPQSLWGLAGNPGAGTYSTALTGTALSSTAALVTGQLNFVDPVTGNSYLNRFQGCATIPGVLVLADRLWHNGGFNQNTTVAQTMTSVTLPARDLSGTTAGAGVLAALEISAGASAQAPTITLVYTNSGGTGSRTATNTWPTANSPTAGSMFPIGLQAGDVGIKIADNLTLSVAWTTGTMNLVLYRPLVALELVNAYIPNAVDALTSNFPRLFNGTVPFMYFIPQTTTASYISGQYAYTQG